LADAHAPHLVDEQHVFRVLQLGEVVIGRGQQAEEGRGGAVAVAVWRLGEPVESWVEEHPECRKSRFGLSAAKRWLQVRTTKAKVATVSFGSLVCLLRQRSNAVEGCTALSSSLPRKGKPSLVETVKPPQRARGVVSQDSKQNRASAE